MNKALFTLSLQLLCFVAQALPSLNGLKSIDSGAPSLFQKTTYNDLRLSGSKLSSMHRFSVKVFNSKLTYRCSGVLIQERFVLIAGHCFGDMKDFVVELSLDENGKNWERIPALRSKEHDEAKINGSYKYDFEDYENNRMQDVGMLLLTRKPKWARPVKMLNESMELLASYLKYTRLVGFERTKNFEITENLAYIKFGAMEPIAQGNYALYFTENEMGMCRGDSGGGTSITVNGEHYLVGITSAYKGGDFKNLPNSESETADGLKVARCSKKVLLLHTGRQLEWIEKTMGELAQDAGVETPTDLKVYTLNPLPTN